MLFLVIGMATSCAGTELKTYSTDTSNQGLTIFDVTATGPLHATLEQEGNQHLVVISAEQGTLSRGVARGRGGGAIHEARFVRRYPARGPVRYHGALLLFLSPGSHPDGSGWLTRTQNHKLHKLHLIFRDGGNDASSSSNAAQAPQIQARQDISAGVFGAIQNGQSSSGGPSGNNNGSNPSFSNSSNDWGQEDASSQSSEGGQRDNSYEEGSGSGEYAGDGEEIGGFGAGSGNGLGGMNAQSGGYAMAPGSGDNDLPSDGARSPFSDGWEGERQRLLEARRRWSATHGGRVMNPREEEQFQQQQLQRFERQRGGPLTREDRQRWGREFHRSREEYQNTMGFGGTGNGGGNTYNVFNGSGNGNFKRNMGFNSSLGLNANMDLSGAGGRHRNYHARSNSNVLGLAPNFNNFEDTTAQMQTIGQDIARQRSLDAPKKSSSKEGILQKIGDIEGTIGQDITKAKSALAEVVGPKEANALVKDLEGSVDSKLTATADAATAQSDGTDAQQKAAQKPPSFGTGFFVGAGLGGAEVGSAEKFKQNNTSATITTSGLGFGAQLFGGYEISHKRFYFAGEGAWTPLAPTATRTYTDGNGTAHTNKLSLKNMLSASARVGYYTGMRTLFYGRLGAAMATLEQKSSGPSAYAGGAQKKLVGFLGGAGAEVQLSPALTARLDVTDTHFSTVKFQQKDATTSTNTLATHQPSATTYMLGITYHINAADNTFEQTPDAKKLASEGFYGGLQGGMDVTQMIQEGKWSNTSQRLSFPALSRNLAAAIFAGYGWKVNKFYIGGEAFFSPLTQRVKNTLNSNGSVTSMDVKLQNMMGAILRPGYALPDGTLIFAQLGVVRAKTNATLTMQSTSGRVGKNMTGFVYGFGVESPLTDNISLRGDVRQMHFGSVKKTLNILGGGTIDASTQPLVTEANLGLTMNLGALASKV